MKATLKKLFVSRKVLLVVPFLIVIVALTGCLRYDGAFEYDADWQNYESNDNCEADTSKPTIGFVSLNQGLQLSQVPFTPILLGRIFIPGTGWVDVSGTVNLVPFGAITNLKFTYDVPQQNATCVCELNLVGLDYEPHFLDQIIDTIHMDTNKPNQCKIYVDGECDSVTQIRPAAAGNDLFAEIP